MGVEGWKREGTRGREGGREGGETDGREGGGHVPRYSDNTTVRAAVRTMRSGWARNSNARR